MRIRTRKPEFYTDEKIAVLPPIDRFVFGALIDHADDAGRLLDNEKTLDGAIFPYTDESVAESLKTLATLGRIIRYTADDGKRLIQIRHWGRHQKVDHPSKYVLPPPPGYPWYPTATSGADAGVTGEDDPSRDSREDLASPSRPDRVPPTSIKYRDHRPATSVPEASAGEATQLRAAPRPSRRTPDMGSADSHVHSATPPALRSPGADPGSPAEALGGPLEGVLKLPGVKHLLRRWYGWTGRAQLTARQLEVAIQLAATLAAPGAKLKREFVMAASPRHLNEICDDVAMAKLRKADAAIVVVLMRVRATRQEFLAAAEQAARNVEVGDVLAEVDRARAWLESRPDAQERIERRLRAQLPKTPSGPMTEALTNGIREQYLIDEFRSRCTAQASGAEVQG